MHQRLAMAGMRIGRTLLTSRTRAIALETQIGAEIPVGLIQPLMIGARDAVKQQQAELAPHGIVNTHPPALILHELGHIAAIQMLHPNACAASRALLMRDLYPGEERHTGMRVHYPSSLDPATLPAAEAALIGIAGGVAAVGYSGADTRSPATAELLQRARTHRHTSDADVASLHGHEDALADADLRALWSIGRVFREPALAGHLDVIADGLSSRGEYLG